MEGEARGKKYGESDVDGVEDDADIFWFCKFCRGDEGDCGAMKLKRVRKEAEICGWLCGEKP